MNDFKTKCSICGKRIRVSVGSKKRRCVECDFKDIAARLNRSQEEPPVSDFDDAVEAAGFPSWCGARVEMETGAKLGPCILKPLHGGLHSDGGNSWMVKPEPDAEADALAERAAAAADEALRGEV